ncbi:MAG: PEP-CTERM sorting domain-containing protein [Caldimonas sp.]
MKRVLSTFALLAVSLGANAQLTSASGPVITFAGFGNPGGLPTQTMGVENGLVSSSLAGSLTATFLGKSALDTNKFSFAMGGMLLNTQAIGSNMSMNVGIGALPFTFSDLFTGTSVANGGPVTAFTDYVVLGTGGSGGSFTPFTDGGLYQIVLGFNDGLRVDADYNDMVVGLNVTAVPEPETYALLLAGLGAIGFVARRRKV